MDRRTTSLSLIAALAVAAGGIGAMSCGQAALKELTPATSATPDYTWKSGVMPIFAVHDCAQPACHSQTTKQGGLVLDPTMSSHLLYTLVVTSGGNIQKSGNGKEADTSVPLNSLLVTKPTGTYSPGGHTGGALFTTDSSPGSDYEKILNWVQLGAQDD